MVVVVVVVVGRHASDVCVTCLNVRLGGLSWKGMYRGKGLLAVFNTASFTAGGTLGRRGRERRPGLQGE